MLSLNLALPTKKNQWEQQVLETEAWSFLYTWKEWVCIYLITHYDKYSNQSCSKSISNFFPTPPIKLKLGLQIGGRLLIATHLDQSNFLANQQQVIGFAVPVTSPSILCKNARPKTILMSQTSMFWLFFIQFSLAGSNTEHHWSCFNKVFYWTSWYSTLFLQSKSDIYEICREINLPQQQKLKVTWQ